MMSLRLIGAAVAAAVAMVLAGLALNVAFGDYPDYG